MPMGLEDINQFKNLNEVRINVFGYDGRDIFPLRVSKFLSNFTMDLLVSYETDCCHYVLITNLFKVVCRLRNTKFRFAFHISRNFFWLCEEGLAKLTEHMETCFENESAVVPLPAPGKVLYKFKSLAATWFVPLVIYSDFESFLCQVPGCTPHGNNSYTRILKNHKPCGFSLAVVSHKPIFFHVNSSEDCFTNFVHMLHTLAKNIFKRKRAFPFFRGNRSQYPKTQLANVGYVTSLLTTMINSRQLIWITATIADNFSAGLMKNATGHKGTPTLPLWCVKIDKTMIINTFV